MNNLWQIDTIKQLLSRYGFTFSKGLGQNFLINPNVCPEMADSAIENDHTGVLEVGPGFGVLTNELCKRAAKVVSVELDKRLIPVLGETMAEYDNFKLISGDIMNIDVKKIIAAEFSDLDVVVCANLPYYITSPVIMKLLSEKLPIKSLTVMVQKEAADRMCADIGSRESGAITTAVHYYCNPEILFSVSKGSFMPAPKVDSAVIKLKILDTPAVEVKNEKTFFAVIKSGFAQRRKTVLNSLSSGLGVNKATITDILNKSQIPLTARAEKLTLEDFKNIADYLEDANEQNQ